MGVSTPLSAPTTITAVFWIIQGTSAIAWKGTIRLMTAPPRHTPMRTCLFAGEALPCCSPSEVSPACCQSQVTESSQPREKGRWASYTDGGTRVSDGETIAGWSAVARSPDRKVFTMFGPVITTEAHLACARVPFARNPIRTISGVFGIN